MSWLHPNFHIETRANHLYAIRNAEGKTYFEGRKPWIDDVLDLLNKVYEEGYMTCHNIIVNGEF